MTTTATATTEPTRTAPTSNPGVPPDTRLVELALEVLRPSPTNPRKTSDKDRLAELTESVRKVGVLQAIVVRPVAPERTGHVDVPAHYEIVVGERRWKAAKAAGLGTIPATIRHLTDVEVLEIQLVENKEREDVHPLEEAAGIQRYMRAAQVDADAVAAKIGMSKSHVYQRLKLLELIPTAQAPFREGELTAGHAILIARLQPKDQAEAVKAAIQTHWVRGTGQGRDVKAAISVRELAAWIAANVHLELSTAPWDLAADLGPNGPCTTCPRNSDNAPELFPELKRKSGVCTDPAGYQAKLNAFLQSRKAAAAKAAEGKVVELSLETYRGHGEKGRGLVFGRAWQKAGATTCQDTVTGLIVDVPVGMASVLGPLGTLVRACVAKELRCKVHNPPRKPDAWTSRYQRERAKGREAQKTKTAERLAIYTAIFAGGRTWTPTPADWAAILDVHLEGLMDDDADPILAEIAGVDRSKLKRRKSVFADPFRDALRARLPKLDGSTRIRLLAALALAESLDRIGGRRPDPLLDVAKAHRVNVAQVVKSVQPPKKLTAKEKRALVARKKAETTRAKKDLATAASGLERTARKLQGKKGAGPTERKLQKAGLVKAKAVKAALKRAGKKAKGTGKPKGKAKRRAA